MCGLGCGTACILIAAIDTPGGAIGLGSGHLAENRRATGARLVNELEADWADSRVEGTAAGYSPVTMRGGR